MGANGGFGVSVFRCFGCLRRGVSVGEGAARLDLRFFHRKAAKVAKERKEVGNLEHEPVLERILRTADCADFTDFQYAWILR
jgi:hypothetical protein